MLYCVYWFSGLETSYKTYYIGQKTYYIRQKAYYIRQIPTKTTSNTHDSVRAASSTSDQHEVLLIDPV
jgi:hypothetical protein